MEAGKYREFRVEDARNSGKRGAESGEPARQAAARSGCKTGYVTGVFQEV